MATVEVAAMGTEDGFEAVDRRDYAALVRLAALLTGSAAAGEDLVQDAFAEALRRWDRLGNPGGYLRTSVIDRARNVYRRREVEHRLGLRVATPATAAGPAPGGELWDALASLPF